MSDLNKIEAISATEYALYDKIQMCIREVLKKKKGSPGYIHPKICKELWYMHDTDSYRAEFLMDNIDIGSIELELNSVLTDEMLDQLNLQFEVKLPVYGEVVKFMVEPVDYQTKLEIDRYVKMLEDTIASPKETIPPFITSGDTALRVIKGLLHCGIYPNGVSAVWYDDSHTAISLPVNSDMETAIDVPNHSLILKYTVDLPKEVVDRYEKMEKL